MADGAAALEAHIARLRQLPGLVQRAAPEIARAVELELRLQIGAGVDPSGKALVRTAEGKQPLRGAAAALEVHVVGTVVVCSLTGVEARHHLGWVKGGIRRQILPTGRIPDPMTRAIRKVCVKHFEQTMGVR